MFAKTGDDVVMGQSLQTTNLNKPGGSVNKSENMVESPNGHTIPMTNIHVNSVIAMRRPWNGSGVVMSMFDVGNIPWLQ